MRILELWSVVCVDLFWSYDVNRHVCSYGAFGYSCWQSLAAADEVYVYRRA